MYSRRNLRQVPYLVRTSPRRGSITLEPLQDLTCPAATFDRYRTSSAPHLAAVQ
ncbi:hypothetical protein J6590_037610 [Homalodisca vitripennis]|nr:hypothetical protein J6590_037610 [Homalodisca vitripennis]